MPRVQTIQRDDCSGVSENGELSSKGRAYFNPLQTAVCIANVRWTLRAVALSESTALSCGALNFVWRKLLTEGARKTKGRSMSEVSLPALWGLLGNSGINDTIGSAQVCVNATPQVRQFLFRTVRLDLFSGGALVKPFVCATCVEAYCTNK